MPPNAAAMLIATERAASAPRSRATIVTTAAPITGPAQVTAARAQSRRPDRASTTNGCTWAAAKTAGSQAFASGRRYQRLPARDSLTQSPPPASKPRMAPAARSLAVLGSRPPTMAPTDAEAHAPASSNGVAPGPTRRS